jgi:hypothetical protein
VLEKGFRVRRIREKIKGTIEDRIREGGEFF